MVRIVSFLPSATEMVFALGLGDALVGVTHECDYPPEAKSKPTVVRNVLPVETMSQSEIDRAVAERMHNGDSLYQIDEQMLRSRIAHECFVWSGLIRFTPADTGFPNS